MTSDEEDEARIWELGFRSSQHTLGGGYPSRPPRRSPDTSPHRLSAVLGENMNQIAGAETLFVGAPHGVFWRGGGRRYAALWRGEPAATSGHARACPHKHNGLRPQTAGPTPNPRVTHFPASFIGGFSRTMSLFWRTAWWYRLAACAVHSQEWLCHHPSRPPRRSPDTSPYQLSAVLGGKMNQNFAVPGKNRTRLKG